MAASESVGAGQTQLRRSERVICVPNDLSSSSVASQLEGLGLVTFPAPRESARVKREKCASSSRNMSVQRTVMPANVLLRIPDAPTRPVSGVLFVPIKQCPGALPGIQGIQSPTRGGVPEGYAAESRIARRAPRSRKLRKVLITTASRSKRFPSGTRRQGPIY
jgi:hypothetical protein